MIFKLVLSIVFSRRILVMMIPNDPMTDWSYIPGGWNHHHHAMVRFWPENCAHAAAREHVTWSCAFDAVPEAKETSLARGFRVWQHSWGSPPKIQEYLKSISSVGFGGINEGLLRCSCLVALAHGHGKEGSPSILNWSLLPFIFNTPQKSWFTVARDEHAYVQFKLISHPHWAAEVRPQGSSWLCPVKGEYDDYTSAGWDAIPCHSPLKFLAGCMGRKW